MASNATPSIPGQETPRDVPCKTRGQDATSFPIGLLHPLQHAGLGRRTPSCRSPGQNRGERFMESPVCNSSYFRRRGRCGACELRRLPVESVDFLGKHGPLPKPQLAADKQPHRSEEIGNIIGVLCPEEPYPPVGNWQGC
jgi:hypothetical protein